MERELAVAWPQGAADLPRWAWSLVRRPWTLAQEHGLNPWVFIVMAGVGHGIQVLIFLPWFQTGAWQLAFLVLLRVAALVVPSYILIRGRGIAAAFNVSVAVMFVVNTAWSVCYYLYS